MTLAGKSILFQMFLTSKLWLGIQGHSRRAQGHRFQKVCSSTPPLLPSIYSAWTKKENICKVCLICKWCGCLVLFNETSSGHLKILKRNIWAIREGRRTYMLVSKCGQQCPYILPSEDIANIRILQNWNRSEALSYLQLKLLVNFGFKLF